MKRRNSHLLTPVAAAGACLSFAFLANNAQAQQDYFDSNGATPGYGIPISPAVAYWDDANWATTAGGSAATANWTPGSFARFYGGTNTAYTVEVSSSEEMTGLYNHGPGSTLTLAQGGGGALDVITAIQGFIAASGTTTYIDIPITGNGGVAPESGGTLYLDVANSYTGGTALGDSGNTLTYFNNDGAFSTGGISLNRTGNYSTLGAIGGSPLTIANNFSMGHGASATTGTGIHFANAANTPVDFTGTWSLGNGSAGTNLVLKADGGSGSSTTLSGAISGKGNLIVTSGTAGTKIILSAQSTGFTGALAVEGTAYSYGATTGAAGILQFGIANATPNATGMKLDGGTLNPGGYDQIMSAAVLTLSSSSTIDFSSGAALLEFANSTGATWSGILNLVDYSTDGSTYGLDFGASGLTSGQLADIEFNGDSGTLGEAYLTPGGFVAVPEPSSIALLSVLGGLGMMFVRRRKV